jgi:hypothetical protein
MHQIFLPQRDLMHAFYGKLHISINKTGPQACPSGAAREPVLFIYLGIMGSTYTPAGHKNQSLPHGRQDPEDRILLKSSHRN